MLNINQYPFVLCLRIPEFSALWKDILNKPQSLCPQFTGLYAYKVFFVVVVSVLFELFCAFHSQMSTLLIFILQLTIINFKDGSEKESGNIPSFSSPPTCFPLLCPLNVFSLFSKECLRRRLVVRELMHRHSCDADNRQKLRVLFSGACYRSFVCSIQFTMLKQGLSN